MQQPDAIPLRPLAAPVIAGGRVGVTVPHEALDRRQVDAGIEQVASERAPQIVG